MSWKSAVRNLFQNPNLDIELRKFAETITKYILAKEKIREERGATKKTAFEFFITTKLYRKKYMIYSTLYV